MVPSGSGAPTHHFLGFNWHTVKVLVTGHHYSPENLHMKPENAPLQNHHLKVHSLLLRGCMQYALDLYTPTQNSNDWHPCFVGVDPKCSPHLSDGNNSSFPANQISTRWGPYDRYKWSYITTPMDGLINGSGPWKSKTVKITVPWIC